MNYKRLFMVVLAIIVMLALGKAEVANAITNGQPDGEGHPYIGLVVFDDASGPAWRCTASLIAPKVLLTAGHCTSGAVKARVWFAPDLRAAGITDYPAGGTTAIEGEPYAHPNFCNPSGQGAPKFDPNDLRILVLH